MSPRRLVSLLSLVALVALASAGGLTACATPSAKSPPSAAPAAVALDWPESGKPLEHLEAFQNQVVKVGLISLRGGASMPEHASPLPVLLLASAGRGTVTTANGSFALDAAHAVFLPGGHKHSVTAQEGEVLRIAVVAMKSEGAAPADHHGMH